MKKIALFAATLWIAGCQSTSDGESANAAVGSPGVEFLVAPIDGGACHSTVLRGTKRMAGVAYVLPQVRLGRDSDQRPLFHVLQDDKGYLLTMGLFFPDGTGDQTGIASDGRTKPDCTYEEIKTRLNANLAPDDQVKTVAPLPSSRVVARVPLADTGYLDFNIGSEETSIVDLVGKDKLLHARVADEGIYRTLTALLRSTGFQIEVNFHFTAQTTSTAKGEIDLSEAGAAIDAAFSGAGATASGVMLEGELTTRLATALRSAKINIQVDGDDDFRAFAEEILKQLIVSNPDIAFKEATPPSAKAPSTAQGESPAGTTETPAESTDTPAESTEGAGATSQSAPGVLPRFKASAAVAALKKQSKFSISLSRTGSGSEYVYTTHATLRTSQVNANREPYVDTPTGPGGAGRRVLQFEEDIVPGSAFFIAATSRRIRNLSYAYRSVDYKTAEQIREARISDRFPILAQYPDSIYDAWDTFPRAAMYTSWYSWSVNTWGYETLETELSNETYEQLPTKSIESLNYIQVTFSNSAGAPIDPTKGRAYGGIPLSLLPREGEARGGWSAQLDPANNRVLLIAKERLGRMTIINNEHETFGSTTQVRSGGAPLYEQRYFQAKWGAFGGRLLSETKYSNVGDRLTLPLQQSSVKLQIIPVTVRDKEGAADPAAAAAPGVRSLNVEIAEDFAAASVGGVKPAPK